MSLSRPTTRQAPSSSISARSPVCSQPVGVDGLGRGGRVVEVAARDAGAPHPQLARRRPAAPPRRPGRRSARRCRPAAPRRSPGGSGRDRSGAVCSTAPQVSVMPKVIDSRAPNTDSTRSTKAGVTVMPPVKSTRSADRSVPRQVGMGRQQVQQRGRGRQQGRPAVGHRAEHRRRGEGQDDVLGPRPQRPDHAQHVARGVEQRHRVHPDPSRRGAEAVGERAAGDDHAGVGDLHALGPARRAGGELDLREALRVDHRQPRRARRARSTPASRPRTGGPPAARAAGRRPRPRGRRPGCRRRPRRRRGTPRRTAGARAPAPPAATAG